MTKPQECRQTRLFEPDGELPAPPAPPAVARRQVGQLGDLTTGAMASPEAFAEFARGHGWRTRIAPGRSGVGGVTSVVLYDDAAPTLETYWLDPAAGRVIRHFGCRYEAAGGRYATPAEQLRIVAAGPTRLA